MTTATANLISVQISERRELNELTEENRNKLRKWVKRIALGYKIFDLDDE